LELRGRGPSKRVPGPRSGGSDRNDRLNPAYADRSAGPRARLPGLPDGVEPPFVDTPLAADLDPAGEFPDSAYERLYARFARFAREQYESAIAPSDVAETIRRAAEEPDPRTRYPVGLRARFQSLLGALPARLRYRVWERAAD